MPFETHTAGRHTVVVLCGEIDIHRAPPVRRQILDLVEAGRHLVLDLGSVTYLDSAGMAVMVEGRQRARERGLDFALAAVTVPAMKLLQLTRLDTVFPIYASVEQCLQQSEPQP